MERNLSSLSDSDQSGNDGRSPHITDEEYDRIAEARAAAKTDATRQNYGSSMKRFTGWLSERGVPAQLPAHPGLVALYLLECHERHGLKISTIERIASAIGDAHRSKDLPSPTKHPDVTDVLSGLRRTKRGEGVKQANALARDGLHAIIATAHIPRRRGRRNGMEEEETARKRGDVDIALVHTQFDGMFRVGELVNLIWGDIEYNMDGKSGTARIRFSKTDQEGAGAYVWLSPGAMAALANIKPQGAKSADRIFPMSAYTAARRIKNAGIAAGLGDILTGHSARVGMTIELVKADISIAAIMQGGRWTTAEMVPYYSRNLVASDGAVAQWYRKASNVSRTHRVAGRPIAVRHPDFVGG